MTKERKLITLSRDVIDDIDKRTKEEAFNFSDWVEVTYFKQNMTEEGVKIQLDFHQKQAEKLKNRLNYLKRKGQIRVNHLKRNVTKEMKEELKHSKKVIKENPAIIEGRVRYWNNKFNQNLSKGEFMRLLGLL